MRKDIKILATLGPASMKKSIVQAMDSYGVDIFRVNLSHTRIEDFLPNVESIAAWSQKPICVDTEGAQIRTATIRDNAVMVKRGGVVRLATAEIAGEGAIVPLYPIVPHEALEVGDVLNIDFDSASIEVIKVEKGTALARVLSGGKIRSNRGVGVSGRSIALPALTGKDLEILRIAKKIGLTHFALSFASCARDVRQLRKFFPYPIFAISKIESRPGILNLESICAVSDAILIDRGDLSRDVPLYRMGLAQKHILSVANKMGVPAYVATNLLETMVRKREPTRAEINDITSALLYGADGLVLAAETAIGRYPAKSARMACEIRREVLEYFKRGNITDLFLDKQDHLKKFS